MTTPTYPITEFMREIGDVEVSDDPKIIRSKSHDRYGISPLLRQMLKDKKADVVVTPRTLDDVLSVARAAVKYRIPITARGGGTANYGQSVPLRGGIMLDMTGYTGVVSVEPGLVRARAGTIVEEIEVAARATGWELRMHPTTKLEATIGGFIAGGSGGPGSVAYGQLEEPGNILSAQIVTMEDEPRVLELEGREASRIYHTYGATGIITEIGMPTAPAWDWWETIVAFPEYMDVLRFAFDMANAPGIVKKVMSVQEWPTPSRIAAFAPLVPEGHSIVSTMIAPQSWPEFAAAAEARGGVIVCRSKMGEGPYGRQLTEFVFGHALLHVRKTDPRRSLIEGFLPGPDLPSLVEKVRARVGSYGPMRLELIRTPEGTGAAALAMRLRMVLEPECEIAAIDAQTVGVLCYAPSVSPRTSHEVRSGGCGLLTRIRPVAAALPLDIRALDLTSVACAEAGDVLMALRRAPVRRLAGKARAALAA